jgi:hypothetical protein
MRIRRLLVTIAVAGLVPAVSARAEEPKADADKIICKKEVETGSLVQKKKRCFTKAEWARIAEANQAQGRYIQEHNLLSGERGN